MINSKELNEKIAKGLGRVIEVTNENIIVAYKQFNMEEARLGIIVELPEEIATQSKKELIDEIAKLEIQVAEMKAFLVVKQTLTAIK